MSKAEVVLELVCCRRGVREEQVVLDFGCRRDGRENEVVPKRVRCGYQDLSRENERLVKFGCWNP